MIILLSLLLPLAVLGSSAPTSVVPLTDADFEHHTQASTGQTTGVWCVLFTSSHSDGHKEAVQLWTALAEDEEKEVIYAMIDLDANKQTAARFRGVQVPAAVLLRDRAMYTYSIPNEDDSAEIIHGFVSGGYTQLPRQSVPAPGSGLLGSTAKAADVDETQVFKLKIAFMVIVVALAWKAGLYMASLTRGAGTAAAAPAQGAAEAAPAAAESKPQDGKKAGDKKAEGKKPEAAKSKEGSKSAAEGEGTTSKAAATRKAAGSEGKAEDRKSSKADAKSEKKASKDK